MPDFASMITDAGKRFHGGVLVEASAGTGKTYNIQNVFLRLVVADALPVSAILVVTFTEAATQELRERLRRILNDCHRLLTGTADDTITARIRPIIDLPLTAGNQEAGDKSAVQLRCVRRALMEFDNAAIFTIHGFCNRVLERYAFECGGDPDAELLSNSTILTMDICRDWWRRNTYNDRPAQDNPFDSFDLLHNALKDAAASPDARLEPSLPAEKRAAVLRQFAEALRNDISLFPRAEGSNGDTREFEKVIRDTGALPANEHMTLARAAIFLAAMPKPSGNVRPRWKEFGGAGSDISARLPQSSPVLDRMKEAVDAAQAAIVAELRHKINGALLDRNAITYDAMLSRLRDALRDEAGGAALRRVLRAEFQAALIDEFQDTDPIQYEIFRNLFLDDGAPAPFLLVGDPKQAIYSFRNGDIFTYFGAAGSLAGHASLGTNYRSEKDVVKGVNEFFADTAGQRAFRSDHIAFVPVQANGVTPEREMHLDSGNTDAAPMKICCYAAEKDAVPGMDSPVARQIYSDVAAEIAGLLGAQSAPTINGRPLSAQDIAILVCTHDEAELLGAELVARGVPFIRQATRSVFDSPWASKLALLAMAMLAPGNIAAIRGVLGCGLLPCTPDQLFPTPARNIADQPPADDATGARQSLEWWVALFREANNIWLRHTFVEAFQHIEQQCGVYAHIAAGGSVTPETDIAIIRQLVETCHVTASAGRLSPTALTHWLLNQLDAEHREESDSHLERPGSDDAAVRIMTIFAAKGLEFPIVFVPTLWRREAAPRRAKPPFAAYHDDELRLVLDISQGAAAKVKSNNERLQENIRLAYVALTRAINRTYLYVITNSETGCSVGGEDDYAIAHLYNRWRRAAPTGSAIEVRHASPADGATRFVPARMVPVRVYNDGKAMVDKRYGHTSFSSLASGRSVVHAGTRDIDSTDDMRPGAETVEAGDIFLFPGGARIGDCWHAVFEALDFRAEPPVLRETIDKVLDSFAICQAENAGLAERKRQAVHHMVEHVLNVPLPVMGQACSLREIALESRRSELVFHFPLRRCGADVTLERLGKVLDGNWHTAARDTGFIQTLCASDRTLPRGFLTGSIDLLFQHQGRFYIIDWKSNRLGGLPGNFCSAGIKHEMAAHSYYLQYLLYTVAVERFLRQTLHDYSYERHFGGVFYLFLRGIDGTTPRGIFHDRPDATTISELAALLAPSPGA